MTGASGAELSFGLDWRTSIMANSARDPYWQASVRRETLDHPAALTKVQNECAICHMPMSTYQERARGRPGLVFAYLPFGAHGESGRFAQDAFKITHWLAGDPAGAAGAAAGAGAGVGAVWPALIRKRLPWRLNSAISGVTSKPTRISKPA